MDEIGITPRYYNEQEKNYKNQKITEFINELEMEINIINKK